MITPETALKMLEAMKSVQRDRENIHGWINGGPAGRAILAAAGITNDRQLRDQAAASFAAFDRAIALAEQEMENDR